MRIAALALLAVMIALVSFDGMFADAYTTSSSRVVRFQHTTRLQAEPEGVEGDKFGTWYNENHPSADIDEWWRTAGSPGRAFGKRGPGKALMTIGKTGVTASHVNSIVDLLKSHKHVRVKIATDRLDTRKISKEIMESESVNLIADLLAVKKTEFMFGQK